VSLSHAIALEVASRFEREIWEGAGADVVGARCVSCKSGLIDSVGELGTRVLELISEFVTRVKDDVSPPCLFPPGCTAGPPHFLGVIAHEGIQVTLYTFEDHHIGLLPFDDFGEKIERPQVDDALETF